MVLRKTEPLSIKRANSNTKNVLRSSANSNDEEDTDGNEGDHNNKGDPPGKQLSTSFGTPTIEEPYTKF